MREKAGQRIQANKPDAVNPAMTLQFALGDQWRRVTDLGRSATKL